MRRATSFCLLLVPSLAMANVVWPAVYLMNGLYVWWVIAIGLLIELAAIRRLFSLRWARAVVVDVSANATSALLGFVLIPFAGLVYELLPGRVVNSAFSWGTFNPVAWVATLLMAAGINLVVEGSVMKGAFKIAITRRARFVLYATNLVTAVLAVYPMSQQLRHGA